MENQTENQNAIRYLCALSYAAIERSKLPRKQKRSMIASVYALVGLIDDGEFLHPSEELYRYALCFKLPLDKVGDMAADMKAGDVTEGGAVLVEEKGEKFFKFDVGSPLWDALKGNFDEEGKSLPRVLSAYETADAVTALGGTALSAMWYILFPYCMQSVPFDRVRYDALRERLTRDEVFEEALAGRYAFLIFDDVQEAAVRGVDPAVIEWYRPFIEYKLSPDSAGTPRAIALVKRKLALRAFDEAADMSERLLPVFPSDGQLLLLHIAARTQSVEGKDRDARNAVLTDTLELIDTVAGTFPDQAVYLGYYRGLTLLGLGRADEAREQFETTLSLDPAFEPAQLMLKGMDTIKRG